MKLSKVGLCKYLDGSGEPWLLAWMTKVQALYKGPTKASWSNRCPAPMLHCSQQCDQNTVKINIKTAHEAGGVCRES